MNRMSREYEWKRKKKLCVELNQNELFFLSTPTVISLCHCASRFFPPLSAHFSFPPLTKMFVRFFFVVSFPFFLGGLFSRILLFVIISKKRVCSFCCYRTQREKFISFPFISMEWANFNCNFIDLMREFHDEHRTFRFNALIVAT